MKQNSTIISLLLDLILCISICVISYFLISFYANAQYLNTGYFDWIVQAFRIKLLKEFGFTSWIHIWANGINVWQTYQFVPHFISLVVVNILNLPIPRTMMLITICIFVLVRLEIYLILRLLKFSSIAAFSASLLSLTITQFWGGIGDYSLQFAPLFFPVLIYFWVLYFNNKIKYLFPFLVGLSFYIHPELGLYMLGFWLISLLFTSIRIFSLRSFIELLILIISSSVFWYPLVFQDSYHFHNPIYETQSFLSTELLNPSEFGLSISLLVAFIISFINLFAPNRANKKWIKTLTMYNFIFFFLVFCSTQINLPTFIAISQFTRGTMLLGITICFVAAQLVDDVIHKLPLIFRFLLILYLSFAFIEAVWISSIYSPSPGNSLSDSVQTFANQNPNYNVDQSRIWSSDIGTSSYFFTSNLKLDASYMPQFDSNQMSERLIGLILYAPYQNEAPAAGIERLSDYLKLTGTKYIFLDETSPFTKALLDNALSLGYKDLGTINFNTSIYHAFAVPWKTRDAVLVNQSFYNNLNQFPPNITFTNVNDYELLDLYVKNFTTLIYSPKNIVVKTTYPNQETIQITIPPKSNSNVVFLDESYSNGWQGSFNGSQVSIVPTGPNFMKITLPNDNLNDGGIVLLNHTWPKNMLYLGYLILLTPIILIIYNLSLLTIKVFKKTNKKHEKH